MNFLEGRKGALRVIRAIFGKVSVAPIRFFAVGADAIPVRQVVYGHVFLSFCHS
jgi:hypothetical protein